MFFIVIRFDNIDSHMIRIIIVVDKIVDVDPIDDIRFHIVIMSGQDGYRRGIPFIPIMWCGKNVMFVLQNIMVNCIFSHLVFIDKFVIRGIQKINLEIIENTTPIDRIQWK